MDLNEYFDGLRNDQDRVLQDYKTTSPLLKEKGATGALHMFFSPHRIPIGLTDEEVGICVLLYTLKENADKKRFECAERKGLSAMIRNAVNPIILPDELRETPMTQERFRIGVHKFLVQLTKER